MDDRQRVIDEMLQRLNATQGELFTDVVRITEEILKESGPILNALDVLSREEAIKGIQALAWAKFATLA